MKIIIINVCDLMINITKLEQLEENIGINFNNKKHLIEALCHSTYLEENPNFKNQFELVDGHNQRLEHLGDSVLGLIIAEKIYLNHPGREGELTKIKEHYVNGDKAIEISDDIGLEKFLIVGIGEGNSELGRGTRIKDALEALIAAIYLDQKDQGYEKVKEFVNKFFLYDLNNVLEHIDKIIIEDNAIGHLQEIVQKAGFNIPEYKRIKIGGPDHDPTFLYEVYVKNEKIAEASGKSKEAKKKAAKNALNSEFIRNLQS
jgi:ribonuclease-3